MNTLKNSCSQKFYKSQSKIAILKIYSKTELLTYKFFPQKMHCQNDCLNKKKNYQNFSFIKDNLKIVSSKKTLSKLLPQKRHYQNCCLKENIVKIFSSKKLLSKLLPQNRLYQNCYLKNEIAGFTFNLIRIIRSNFWAISNISNHLFFFTKIFKFC